jgi:hypothetical protein
VIDDPTVDFKIPVMEWSATPPPVHVGTHIRADTSANSRLGPFAQIYPVKITQNNYKVLWRLIDRELTGQFEEHGLLNPKPLLSG